LWDQILGPMAFAEPLTDDEIERRLSELDGWTRRSDEISKTFEHTYHECVHLAMYVAAKAREAGHHPDIDIRWQRIRFGITTHDAGHRITYLDFAMARHIDAIAALTSRVRTARSKRSPAAERSDNPAPRRSNRHDMEARRLPAQAASPVQASVAVAADQTAEDQIGQDQASRYTPSSNLAEIRFPGRYGGPQPGIRDTLRPPPWSLPPRQPVLLRQDGLGWESA